MKQLFKTTLLATAVALTCGAAFAGDVAVTKQVHSSEGLVGVTAAQTSNAISYTTKAGYLLGDRITFTFPEGALATQTFAQEIIVAPVNNADANLAIAGLTLSRVQATTTTVAYRVLEVTQPNNAATPPVDYTALSSLGAVITLGTVQYNPAAVAAGNITVTVDSVDAAGGVIDDTGTRTATVAEAKSQFGTAAINTPFDAVIDVAAIRTAFVGNTSDSMTWTITNPDTTGWLNRATVNSTAATVLGETTKMDNVVVGQWTSGGTNTFTAGEAKLAIAYTGLTTNDTVSFAPLTGDKATVLEAQKFTAALSYNYTSAGQSTADHVVSSGLEAGEWTLNGATVNIPYMPYSVNASQIIYISNAGSQEGDVTVTAFDDNGKTWNLGTLGTAKGNQITKMAPRIRTALTEQGFTGARLSITITVNAPADDITVYSSYNVGGNRGFVNTDQYKGK